MKWDENCLQTEDNSKTFNIDCSRSQMDALDEKIWPWVKECIMNSGGYAYEGGVNTKLEAAAVLRDKVGVYALPVSALFSCEFYAWLARLARRELTFGCPPRGNQFDSREKRDKKKTNRQLWSTNSWSMETLIAMK